MAASSRGETVAASTGAGGGAGVPGQAEGKSYFEEQREALCGEIATVRISPRVLLCERSDQERMRRRVNGCANHRVSRMSCRTSTN